MFRILAVALCLLFGSACAQLSTPQDKNIPNTQTQQQEEVQAVLLVANPALQGPFAGTVIYTFNFKGGHLGLVLNRQVPVTLHQLFPEHEASKNVKHNIFVGGPVAANRVMAIVSLKEAPERSLKIGKDLYIVGDSRQVDRIIETAPNSARYFVGYVVWKPGELAAELQRGYFGIHKVDPSIFFEDNKHLYEKFLPKTGTDV